MLDPWTIGEIERFKEYLLDALVAVGLDEINIEAFVDAKYREYVGDQEDEFTKGLLRSLGQDE